MTAENCKSVYKTQGEKLRFFMEKAIDKPEDHYYRTLLRQMVDEIKNFGIEGDSGTRYRVGDVVTQGSVSGDRPVPAGFLTVFKLSFLTEYTRDGVPVEAVSLSEVVSNAFRRSS